MTYNLTLPKGFITFRNGIYQGSNTEAVWSPCNPDDNSGWQDGDILIITCSLNINPAMTNPPPATQYAGLCAGACNDSDQSTINALISQAKQIYVPSPGQLLGTGITTSATPQPSNLFYNAIAIKGTFILTPPSRGTLTNYIYQWTLTYNGNNTIAKGNQVEIVFGYGDPMDSEVDS